MRSENFEEIAKMFQLIRPTGLCTF